MSPDVVAAAPRLPLGVAAHHLGPKRGAGLGVEGLENEALRKGQLPVGHRKADPGHVDAGGFVDHEAQEETAGAHEALGVVGEDGRDVGAGVDEAAAHLDGLVRGDAAGDAEDHPAAPEGVERVGSGGGAHRRGRAAPV